MKDSLLRALIDLRNQQIQKARKAWGNRKGALERGQDLGDSEQYRIVCDWFDLFQRLEEHLDSQITGVIKEYPIYEHVTQVKGIGPSMAAQLAAFIDVEKAPYVSSLWKFAGLGLDEYWVDEDGEVVAPVEGWKYVKDGDEHVRKKVNSKPEPEWEVKTLPDRLLKGWLSPYNKRLKTICMGKVATQLMRASGPYRDEYDRAREHYEQTHPEWSDGHKHYAALRKMVKLFLSHYWERARELHGLEVRRSYVAEHLNHGHISSPEDYGWPEL